MKKLLPLFAACCLFAGACKKDKVTRHDMMVGKWKVAALGVDINANGVLDNGEFMPAETMGMTSEWNLTWNGYALGTSELAGLSQGTDAKWVLSDDLKTLTLMADNQSVSFSVRSLDHYQMTLVAADMAWLIFEKEQM
ncbi:MAG: hypothetical protein EOP49_05225 [Sphingobacteriales bacterium]|nr:MAG: hypothetical protein EOP49_05225 [Sphingobacteriales bacterium]